MPAPHIFRVSAFRIDGEQYFVKGAEVAINPGTPERELQTNADESSGVVETPRKGSFGLSLMDTAELDVRRVRSMAGVTCTIELRNGKTWVCRNAVQTSSDDVNPSDGSVPAMFQGDVEEIFA